MVHLEFGTQEKANLVKENPKRGKRDIYIAFEIIWN